MILQYNKTLTHHGYLYLRLHLVPDVLVVQSALIVPWLIIVLLQSRLEGSLDRVLEVSIVAKDRANGHQNEQSQDDGEVGSEHALALLHGPAASEEGNEDDQDGDDDHDVGGGGVEGDVGEDVIAASVALRAHVVGVIQDTEEGRLGDEDPDTATQHSDAESLNLNSL